MERIATFKQFIEKKPDDPFPRYGLAMEYRNTGRYAEAQKVFDILVEKFPDYVPTYLMSGNNLVDLGRKPDAAAIYQRGIALCAKRGDSRTKGELEAALADLERMP